VSVKRKACTRSSLASYPLPKEINESFIQNMKLMSQMKGAFYNPCNYKHPKGKANFLLGSMFVRPFPVSCPKVVEWNSQALS